MPVRPVLYEDVRFKDSINASCCPCVSITAQYGGADAYPGKFLPRISNVTYRNIDQRGCSNPVTLACNAEAPCEGIVLDGVQTNEDFVVNNTDCVAKDVVGGRPSGCRAGVAALGPTSHRRPG